MMIDRKKLKVTIPDTRESKSVRRTRRATVVIPQITESNSSIRLKDKNRKIVESLKGNNKRMFIF